MMSIEFSSLITFVLFLSILVTFTSANGYENVPSITKPKTEPKGHGYKMPKLMGIQGLIGCKSGSNFIPLKGARARITCLALDRYGYESAPFSVLSCPTDSKGYYFATVSAATELLEGWRIKECKAFLEKSPLKECNVPTDLNRGVSGAPLSSPRHLSHMDLYSVKPFAYTHENKPVPKGY